MTIFSIYLTFSVAWSQNTSELDSLKQSVNHIKDDSIQAEVLFRLVQLSKDADFESSIDYAFQAFEVASKSKDVKLRNKAVVIAGSLFFQKGLFDQAVIFYQKQLELGQEIENESIIGKAYFNLGSVRLILEDYGLASEYYEKALYHIENYNRQNGQTLSAAEEVTIDNALGLVNSGLEAFDKAEILFQKGMEATRTIPHLHYQFCQITNNYADLLIKQGKLEEAKSILKEIIKIEEENQNAAGLIVSLLYLGKVEKMNQNLEESKSHLVRALEIANSISGFSDKKHITSSLSDLYKDFDRPDSALYYLNLSLAYKDSLSIEKAKEELIKSELNQQFLVFKNKLESENQKSQKAYLFLIFISILIIVALVFLYLTLKDRFLTTKEEHSNLVNELHSVVDVNQKLSSQIELKNQEIILSEIQSAKSTELIDELANKLKSNSGKSDVSLELNKLVDDLKSSSGNKTWSEFELRFKQVQGSFYESLIEAYPNLTMNERRLAAFLKLQLTTKEISNITGQSNRAVELARTRLRKKLGLTNSDQNLYDFFLKLGIEEDTLLSS